MAEPQSQKVGPPMTQLSLESFCDKEVQTSPKILEKKFRSRKRKYTASTVEAAPITWGAIKKLCLNAENAMNAQGVPLTTANFFVAMLSLLSVQVSANGTYWAYFPDPPILHTCTWKDSNIPVTSSFPELTDGSRGVQGYKQFVVNFNYSFTGQTDFPPICFFLDSGLIGNSQIKNGCLSVVDAGFLTDSPKRPPKEPVRRDKTTRYLWSLLGKVVRQNQVFVNKSLPKVVHPFKYDDCDEAVGEATNEWIWINIKTGYPSWIYCMYNKENKISIPGTKYYISDWSSNFPEGDYRTYLKLGLLYPWNDTYIPRPLKINRWNSHGWVAPIYTFVYENKTYYQSQLWRLPLTTRKITLIRATTHVEEYYVQTCVLSPYSLLLSNDSEKLQIMQYNMRFYITCQQCILTTCIIPEMNVSTIMVLKRPAYIVLPVALNESWYTDIGAEIIRQVGELIRPKRFVATLILGISALIGILSSFTVATYALVKEVQTAQYANDLSKNISLALATQEAIDRKLEAKVDALEEAVLHIGQELAALKIRLSLTCHKKYSWICVTPLKVNYSEYSWEQIQMHILNVWNSSDLGIDLEHLHKQIYDIAASQYDMNPSKAAAEFLQNLQNYFKDNSFMHILINYGAAGVVIILLLISFPVIIRLIQTALQSVYRTKVELHTAFLKNKKGGDVGSHIGSAFESQHGRDP
ncbi:endogenous retrovirus group K member 6 Env polyprotein-like [Orcinus orca]|uniref:endogenous retrovirus group K member 6 Env polyprotein-like n=1 Tax=Orcinus orca TaxID=9733 RepID=UPI0021130EE3|nr:endogenous retrovirus group K member 6 Env polyprotein-like [Orcinus orca]